MISTSSAVEATVWLGRVVLEPLLKVGRIPHLVIHVDHRLGAPGVAEECPLSGSKGAGYGLADAALVRIEAEDALVFVAQAVAVVVRIRQPEARIGGVRARRRNRRSCRWRAGSGAR